MTGGLKAFSIYLKTERARVEETYDTRFWTLVSQAKVKATENELDLGFQKICGLKGSKLSGGQK